LYALTQLIAKMRVSTHHACSGVFSCGAMKQGPRWAPMGPNGPAA